MFRGTHSALCLKYLNCENVTSDITFRRFMHFQKYFEQQLAYGPIFIMFWESSIALILDCPEVQAFILNLYCTCLCIYTTDPNSLHVPPCRSTCNIRRICRKRTPLKNRKVQCYWDWSPENHGITMSQLYVLWFIAKKIPTPLLKGSCPKPGILRLPNHCSDNKEFKQLLPRSVP